jgi:GntR family transcriptional regulator of vanillate catabolism
MEVRGILEGTAARMAAERLQSDAELDNLRKYQSEMDSITPPDLESFPAYCELNDAFHSELVRLAKSDILRQRLDLLFRLPFASPSALVTSPLAVPDANERLFVGKHQHHAIIDAIAAREASRAEGIAREHARMTRDIIELALAQGHLTSLPGGPLITRPPER